VIFLNAERFLREAVESVFAQTYPHWELLLVDDGSTDRSGEIARRFAADRPDRVRYLEHPGHENRGMSASRNLGIRSARGELVAGFEEQFRHELQMYEDQAFLAKLYLAAPVYVSSRVWDRYRQHSASCVSSVKRSGQYHAVRRFFLSWLEGYLRDREIVHSS